MTYSNTVLGLAIALLGGTMFAPAGARAQPVGERLVGRWLDPDGAPVATYAGSTVLLHFKHSGRIAVDITVLDSKGDQDLFLSVRVDGGKPVRFGLARGVHPGVILASGLSDGPHVVAVRKEGEPGFGAVKFSGPRLDVAGRWLPINVDRPIIEVIGDSDATGICALGPDSPADAVGIWNSSWASEAVSWVGLLEAHLAAAGHAVDMVDLAISGSKTTGEAETYDDAAPGYSSAKFGDYAPPGRRRASTVLLWGGGNDRHGGGDLAASTPASYARLSRFQKGVYDQLAKIFARNPDVAVVLLEYTDPAIPEWRPAYEQVKGLFSAAEQQRIFFLRVYDPKGTQDACELDPDGHPNLALHAAWAAQIFAWMVSPGVLHSLGFPDGEHWEDSD